MLADQQAAFIGLGGHQLCQAIGKIQHLQRPGVLDQAVDVLGDQLLGADQHIDGRVLAGEQFRVIGVGGRAHPRHARGRIEQGIGYLAGGHVDFVGVGHRDDQVRVLDTRAHQNLGVGGMTVHHADIQVVLQHAEARLVGIDHGNVVVFIGQAVRNRGADLAGSENDNLQAPPSPTAFGVDAQRTQFAVQVGALHANRLGKLADAAAGLF